MDDFLRDVLDAYSRPRPAVWDLFLAEWQHVRLLAEAGGAEELQAKVDAYAHAFGFESARIVVMDENWPP